MKGGAPEIPRGDMLAPNAAASVDIDRAMVELARDGYACLGKLASDEWLEALRTRAEQIMLGEVVYEGLFFQLDVSSGKYEELEFGRGWEGPSLAYRKIEKLERDPIFRAWLENPVFGAIAKARLRTAVSLYRAVLFNKSREGGSNLPFHQDGGLFWGLDRDPELQIWTALDDAPLDGGCVEVVPGSHAWGLATPLGGVVPPNKIAERDVEPKVVPLPSKAGDVILIHNFLWHRSGRTRTGKPRRAFTVCYLDAATRCVRKKRAPRVFVPLFLEPDRPPPT